jgi:hypothetical protein
MVMGRAQVVTSPRSIQLAMLDKISDRGSPPRSSASRSLKPSESRASAEITSLRSARNRDADDRYFKDVECMINLTDGKYVTVTESCAIVRKLFEEPER